MEKNTAQNILDVARDIVRSRGYSAFSYADIAKKVGIRKASIHYHFSSKDELVKQLVRQYRESMARQCDRISQSSTRPDEQLMQFAQLYQNGLDQHQICLCAMLAADFTVLSQPVQEEIRTFFQQTETWLTALLQKGCDAKIWECNPSPEVEAKSLIAMLQGAQLLARSTESSTTENASIAFEELVYPLLAMKSHQT